MIWKEKRVLLIILGLLLAANTIYFFTYRVSYQSRLDDREAELTQKQQQLEQAHIARLRAEKRFQSYQQIERDVNLVFDEHWATQTERLTPLIAEVKRLAGASNMTPPSYAFDRSQAVGVAASRRRAAPIGATEVGIAFAVEGTYEQMRRLINLLELSRQFVIIDRISLAAREGQTLALTLHLKTLFRDEKPVASKRL